MHTESIKYSNDLANLNTNIRTKHTNSVNFGSYKGYEYYGYAKDRENMRHSISIKSDNVEKLVSGSITKDIGIQKSFEALHSETQRFLNSVQSIAKVTNEFAGVAKERTIEIKKRNPVGSRIPYAGILPTIFRGGFMEKIGSDLKDVKEDWTDIKRHYESNVKNQHNDLDTVLGKLHYNVDKGLSGSRETYRNIIGELRDYSSGRWNTAQKKIITPMDDFMDSYVSSMYDAVNRKQKRRAAVKAVLLAVGGDIPGLDSLGDLFGDQLGELFSKVIDNATDFFDVDISEKMSDLYEAMPKWAKPPSSSSPITDIGHDILLNTERTSFAGFEHIDDVFSGFMHNMNHADILSNLKEFNNSLNMNHIQDFVKTSGDQIFLGSLEGTANALLRNYENTGKLSAKGLWKEMAYNVISNPIFVVGDNGAEYAQHCKLGNLLDNDLKNAAQKIIQKIPGKLTKGKLSIFVNKGIEFIPDSFVNSAQGKSYDIFERIIQGKPVEEKELIEFCKRMSDFFIEFSRNTDKMDNIAKSIRKIK